MGLVPETPLGRVFRDLAGGAHQRLAARGRRAVPGGRWASCCGCARRPSRWWRTEGRCRRKAVVAAFAFLTRIPVWRGPLRDEDLGRSVGVLPAGGPGAGAGAHGRGARRCAGSVSPLVVRGAARGAAGGADRRPAPGRLRGRVRRARRRPRRSRAHAGDHARQPDRRPRRGRAGPAARSPRSPRWPRSSSGTICWRCWRFPTVGALGGDAAHRASSRTRAPRGWAARSRARPGGAQAGDRDAPRPWSWSRRWARRCVAAGAGSAAAGAAASASGCAGGWAA